MKLSKDEIRGEENRAGKATQSARIYAGIGTSNKPAIDLIDFEPTTILDIGCGAGGNAAVLQSRYPKSKIFGITHSEAEAREADRYMEKCWVFDLESQLPNNLTQKSFDLLLFSHVLEHLRDPAGVLAEFVQLLKREGRMIIAVPNVLSWKMRIQFLFGDFTYQDGGVLDDSHLRFFTFFTVESFLMSQVPDLSVTEKKVTGNVPLWILRRYILPNRWCSVIDALGCKYWPNLFGYQVLLRAVKK